MIYYCTLLDCTRTALRTIYCAKNMLNVFLQPSQKWILFTVGSSVHRDIGRYNGRYSDRQSVDSRSIYRSRFLSVCRVCSPLSIALGKKLEQNYWNMNRLPPLTLGDSSKIRIFGHFSVSYESRLLKIKHESMPFFAIASRFVTFFGMGMPMHANYQ